MAKLPSPARLILPDDPGHGITPAQFDKLISGKDLAKLEALLGWPPHWQGDFRAALRFECWRYYVACLPEAESRRSRAALKREVRRAAKRAEVLASLVSSLWRSEDPVVRRVLGEIAEVWPPRNGIEAHPLTPGFIRFLDQLARKLALLGGTLPDDPGGPRRAKPFATLATALGGMFKQLYRFKQLADMSRPAHTPGGPLSPDASVPGALQAGRMDEPLPASVQKLFLPFIAGVVDILRRVQRKLPAAKLDLPPTDKALEERLRRLAKK